MRPERERHAERGGCTYQLNDKKANKLVREVRFYNGEDRTLDFILTNVYVRIQGTSSVNYARKNFRFYFQKTASGWTVTLSYGEIDGNGRQKNPVVTTGKKISSSYAGTR